MAFSTVPTLLVFVSNFLKIADYIELVFRFLHNFTDVHCTKLYEEL